MWPFKKKIKLVIVDTANEEKRKHDEIIKSEQRKQLQRDNLPILLELVNKIIAELVETHKQLSPQPFQIGDTVLINKYPFANGLGWFASGTSFINTFKGQDERIGYHTHFIVDKVWIDTGWIKDKLDPNWDNETNDLLNIVSHRMIEARLRERVDRLIKSVGGPVTEWAIDFNWKELAFKSDDPNKEYLELKWGGFPAANFIKARSPIGDAQIFLTVAEKRFTDAKEAYQLQEKVFEEEVKRFKVQLTSNQ